MVLSTLSTSPVEEVAATHAKLWFQLYVYKDRGATRELIARVEQAGVRALVLTVDAPLLGRREADVRNRFALPPGLRIENLRAQDHARVDAHASDSGLADYFQRVLDPSLGYRDLEWLCATARVPVLVKGVVRGDDARRAIAHGARGVIVSNHGGRQLDGAPASIEALPHVAEAVADAGIVLMDGGIRRGADVIKALALGARAVLVGRPILWGLAVAGEAGAREVLRLLRDEIDLALALCGCARLADIDRSLVRPGHTPSL
jgi:4-hydroxymandelate oxidase